LADIQAHLDACPSCLATLGQTEDDPFLARLRRAGRRLPADDDSARTTLAGFVPGETAETAAALPWLPGYEILSELGRGGMGVVYQARHLALNRLVALKVLLAGAHASPEALVRFRAEAEGVARLRHPNVVQVYDLGSHAGLPFFALELCEGGTLAQHSRGLPQPPRHAAELVETLARALACAHEQGIVHRDLKPSNVLLDAEGTAKLADFGVAKWVGGEGLTGTGAAVGTPSYMAPEQALGHSHAVGPAADVYALGAILYELLTGRPPFQGTTPLETLEQVVSQEPVPPGQLQARLPRDLTTICLKCLRKEAPKRYAGALDLAEDLARYLHHEPIRARPVGATERGWRWCRRHPAVAALSAAVVLLAVLLTVGALVTNAGLRESLKESDEARRKADEARRKADEDLWKSYLAEARAVRFSGRVGQRLAGLAAIRKALALPVPQGHSLDELRTEAVACLCLPDVEEVRRWPGRPEGTAGLCFDGPLKTYLRATSSGEVSVRRVADDTEVAHFKAPRPDCRLSPDARFVLVEPWGGPGPLELLRLEDGGARRCLFEPAVDSQFFTFSSDSRLLAYRRTNGTLVIHDLAADRTVAEWPLSGRSRQWSLAFSPERGRLALGLIEGRQNLIQVRKVPTGEVLARLPHPEQCGGIVWHPDGERLAVGCFDCRIHFWDVAAQKELSSWQGLRSQGIQFLAIDGAAGQLASFAWDRQLRLWDVESGEQAFSTPFQSWDGWMARSSAGQGMHVVSREGRHELRLLRLVGGREHRKLAYRTATGRTPYDPFLFSSPDDRFLVIEVEGTAPGAIVDAETGQRVSLLPASAGGSLRPLGFDRSGSLLTYHPERMGLVCWPVQGGPGAGVRFGPPRRLLWEYGGWTWGASADGQVIAIPKGNGAVVVSLTVPRRRIVLPGQADVRYCAVSPDGRFTATGSHHTPPGQSGCHVWSAADGKPLRKLPLGGIVGLVKFSPDGGWLGTRSEAGGTRLWRSPTWEEGPLLDDAPRSFAFAPDGRTVAVGQEGGVRLCVTESGRPLCRLETREQTVFEPLAFSRDGARLYARDGEGYVHVWDLRQIRRGLAELGLDWDAPPLPVRAAGASPRPSLRVEVDRGALASFQQPLDETEARRVERCTLILRADPDDVEAYHHRAYAYESLGQLALAVADFTEALKRQPDDDHLLACRGRDRLHLKQDEAGVADLERSLALKRDQADLCDLLARLRARGPGRLRNPKTAVALAKRGVGLEPKQVRYRGTLGIALYHDGRAREAVAPLEESLEGATGLDAALHRFYLAMCYHRLADPVKAKDCFDRAVQWQAGQKSLPAAQAELYRSYQADAEKELNAEIGHGGVGVDLQVPDKGKELLLPVGRNPRAFSPPP
jgi:WD40 repeat protein/tetratricopeptide (TPR) repeat protein